MDLSITESLCCTLIIQLYKSTTCEDKIKTKKPTKETP